MKKVAVEDSRLNKISRRMTMILRHGAPKFGLDIRPDGYVYVDEMLNLEFFKGISVDDVRMIVAADSKGRLELRDTEYKDCRGNPRLEIKARQGHSIQKLTDLLLRPILLSEVTENVVAKKCTCIGVDPSTTMVAGSKHGSNTLNEDEIKVPCLRVCSFCGGWRGVHHRNAAPRYPVHGTSLANYNLIKADVGMRVMNRLHMHFGRSKDAKSGVRASSKVLIYVDLEKCLSEGMQWFESENGVLLTSGFEGVLPSRLFNRVDFR